MAVRITSVMPGAQATIDMTTENTVSKIGGDGMWHAVFVMRSTATSAIGELGVGFTISLWFELGANLVDVRDGYRYDGATGEWQSSPKNVGVRVVCSVGTLTVSALEAAISSASTLIVTSVADPTPSAAVDITSMVGLQASASAFGGSFIGPTTEGCKLTSLGLEVGTVPGLFRRLPAAQRQ